MTAAAAPLSSPRLSGSLSRRFWVNLFFLCGALGLSEAARGIVVPTLALYVVSMGGTSLFLALVVAAFSVGRLISSLVYGVSSDYVSLRVLLVLSVAITVVGHVMFVSAGSAAEGGLYVLLLSRTLTGFGTGVLSLARSFVARETSSSDRTRFMAWLGVVQFVGYAFTPIVGGIQINLGAFNTYTAGTYILLVLDVGLGVGLWCGMQDMAVSTTPAVAVQDGTTSQVALDVEQATEVQLARRKGGYSELDDSALDQSSQEDVDDDDTDSAAAATVRVRIRSPVLHTLTDDDARSPLHAYAAVFPSPAHAARSHRSVSVSTPSHRATVVVAPPPKRRRESAPAVLTRDNPSTSPLFSLASSSPASAAPLPPITPRSASLVAALILHPHLTPILFILLNLANRGCLSVAETYGAPLYYTVQYGANYDPASVNTMQAAVFYTVLGCIGAVGFVCMDYFTYYVSELTLLSCGFIAMSIGFISMLDPDQDLSFFDLIFSMGCIYCVATPITNTLVSSMLSKSLPKASQGRWMGALTAAGSCGRIIFPLIAGVVSSRYGNIEVALLLPGAVALLSVFAIVVMWRVWHSWLVWWAEVETKIESGLRQRFRHRRTVGGDALGDANDHLGSDDWLSIEQIMEKKHRRANSGKRRWPWRTRRATGYVVQRDDEQEPAEDGRDVVAPLQLSQTRKRSASMTSPTVRGTAL